MTIRWLHAQLHELTPLQVHDLMKLRVDVFVVEQHCAYEEIDGRDPQALHILGFDPQGGLVACCRILDAAEDGFPHVGRVVVREDLRGQGLARMLMQQALEALLKRYGSHRSAIAAQAHLEGFYGSVGYVRVGPDYDWDGIPHVDMVLR
jgi:ElaA protein